MFTILAFTAIMVMIPVGHWYKSFLLRLRKAEGETLKTSVSRPLPDGKDRILDSDPVDPNLLQIYLYGEFE